MPKSRSSNTISNRNPSSDTDNSEMSNRIEDRIEEVNRITVPMYSRTRRQMEDLVVEFEDDGANVTSPSGNIYQVDLDEAGRGTRCTCVDYTYRHPDNPDHNCRHMEAVNRAQGQRERDVSSGSDNDIEVNINNAIQRHIAHEEELERENAESNYTDDGHFYSGNMQEFVAELRELETAEIPYEYDNVLNGSNATFGMELEFVGGNSHEIARELYDLGLCASPSREIYHSGLNSEKWVVESDSSVVRGESGGEIVSPILKDTPETWRQVETICAVARRHGATVSMSTGAHIHVGTQHLDGKGERWKRLFKTFKGSEESIKRFAGGELGRFRDTTYAKDSQRQLTNGLSAHLPDEGSNMDFRIAFSQASVGSDREHTINLNNFRTGKPTVEYRVFNGSLTPGILQANVKLAVGIMQTSERSRSSSSSDSSKRRAEMMNDYDNNNQRNNVGIRRMVDIIFSRKKDKRHILSVLTKNQWN